MKCIFRQKLSDGCPGQRSETQNRECNTLPTNNRKVVCDNRAEGPEGYNYHGFSFQACMGNSPHNCQTGKIIGPGRTEKCSNIISPPGDREVCVQIQECNADGCAVSCYDRFKNVDGHHVICTGCRNGKVKMESQDMKYNYNVTCEQNGEEIPGDFVCEEKCGCVQDKKTGTLSLRKEITRETQ